MRKTALTTALAASLAAAPAFAQDAYVVGLSGALTGFVIFRIFDVIKPFPAARLERLHGGFGVMADDAMAAIYSNLALRVVLWLVPGLMA